MPTFPLRARPAESYREAPRAFGSARDGGQRQHAGCDLYAEAGAEVLAVEDGQVIQGPYPFYDITAALEVRHPCGVVRYGEISAEVMPGIHPGSAVTQGQVIAILADVGHGTARPNLPPMLHFELYDGTAAGQLTDKTRPPFMRREDLQDPADYLDTCTVSEPTEPPTVVESEA